MIADKISQWDRVIVNKYGARWGQQFQWHFEILDMRLRVEDTEAYQEMMKMNHETFCEIFTAALVILPFSISV